MHRIKKFSSLGLRDLNDLVLAYSADYKISLVLHLSFCSMFCNIPLPPPLPRGQWQPISHHTNLGWPVTDFTQQKAADMGIWDGFTPRTQQALLLLLLLRSPLRHNHKPEPAHGRMTSHMEGVETSHPGGDHTKPSPAGDFPGDSGCVTQPSRECLAQAWRLMWNNKQWWFQAPAMLTWLVLQPVNGLPWSHASCLSLGCVPAIASECCASVWGISVDFSLSALYS